MIYLFYNFIYYIHYNLYCTFLQLIGISMGSNPAPFMANLSQKEKPGTFPSGQVAFADDLNGAGSLENL